MNKNIQTAKLKDVCKIEKGKIGITKAIEGEYPLVVTAEERSSHNEWHFDEPATIVPLVSSTGHGHASIKRLHYAEGKYAVGNILATLIPKDHDYLNAKYLYVYLTINKEELLVSQMTGAANVSLTLTRLAEVEIEVPDYETQLQVIKKYEDAQRYKNSMNSQIDTRFELLEKLRQQILQDAITGKLSEKWRKENPNIESAETLLEKIKTVKETLVKDGKIRKQKPLPPITENEIPFELPKEWVWCRLGDVTRLITDGKHGDCIDVLDSGYFFLSAKDIQNGELQYQYARQINEKEFKEVHKRTNLEVGDLCVVNTGATVGKSAIVTNSELSSHTTFQKSVAVIKPIHNVLSVNYLNFFISLNTEKLRKKSGGSAINNLLLRDLKEFFLPLPPLAEQKYIVERIESLFANLNRIGKLNTENQEDVKMLNQVILKEMFEE